MAVKERGATSLEGIGDDAEHDLVRYNKGQSAGAVLSHLGPTLDQHEAEIDRRVYAKLQAGDTLDPQAAVQFWMEKFSIHKLRKTLQTQENRGIKAGKRLGDTMRIPGGD